MPPIVIGLIIFAWLGALLPKFDKSYRDYEEERAKRLARLSDKSNE